MTLPYFKSNESNNVSLQDFGVNHIAVGEDEKRKALFYRNQNLFLIKTAISNTVELLCAGTVWLYSCSVWGEIIQVIFYSEKVFKNKDQENKNQ